MSASGVLVDPNNLVSSELLNIIKPGTMVENFNNIGSNIESMSRTRLYSHNRWGNTRYSMDPGLDVSNPSLTKNGMSFRGKKLLITDRQAFFDTVSRWFVFEQANGIKTVSTRMSDSSYRSAREQDPSQWLKFINEEDLSNGWKIKMADEFYGKGNLYKYLFPQNNHRDVIHLSNMLASNDYNSGGSTFLGWAARLESLRHNNIRPSQFKLIDDIAYIPHDLTVK